MIMKMYSIKDEYNGFTSPIPVQNEESAIRYFKQQIESNPVLNLSPENFSFWEMGTFDTESGTYIQKATDIKKLKEGVEYASKN